MTNDLPQRPAEWDARHPYASLTPDAVLDALADIGLMGDGRLIALSSYENRVYQIQLETERAPVQTDGTLYPTVWWPSFIGRVAGQMRRFKKNTTLRPSW
jgi:hypothetical protein